MPKYIMMIGPPASGKSTWIEDYLSKNPDTKIVSSDNIITKWGDQDGLDYSKAFKKYAKAAMPEMLNRFKTYVENGNDIIHDQTNMSAKSRKNKLAIAQDYYKIAVTFELDDEELQKRSDKRKAETGKSIPGYVVANMKNSYERPTKDEGFDEIIIVKD